MSNVSTDRLVFSIADGMIDFFTRVGEQLVRLGSMPVNTHPEYLQDRLADIIVKHDEVVPTKPKYVSTDIFRTNGTLRYLSLSKTGCKWQWYLRIPNRKVKVLPYRGNLESDIFYLAQLLALHFDVSESSITFSIIKNTIGDLAKQKVFG